MIVCDPSHPPLLGNTLRWFSKLIRPTPICLRLYSQRVRLDAARARCTADNVKPMRMVMMAITTRSSVSVTARRVFMAGRAIVPWRRVVRLVTGAWVAGEGYYSGEHGDLSA